MGPPTPITTIGEARLLRRQKFLEERAREEICAVQPIQGKPAESIQGEVSTVMDVTTSKTAIVKGAGKGVPTSKAAPSILLPEAKNEDWQVKDRDDYWARKGKKSFLLVDAIPESNMDETYDASESWRGARRPKDSSANQYTEREGSSNCSSWNKWKK